VRIWSAARSKGVGPAPGTGRKGRAVRLSHCGTCDGMRTGWSGSTRRPRQRTGSGAWVLQSGNVVWQRWLGAADGASPALGVEPTAFGRPRQGGSVCPNREISVPSARPLLFSRTRNLQRAGRALERQFRGVLWRLADAGPEHFIVLAQGEYLLRITASNQIQLLGGQIVESI
jgi:hypothetical protein